MGGVMELQVGLVGKDGGGGLDGGRRGDPPSPIRSDKNQHWQHWMFKGRIMQKLGIFVTEALSYIEITRGPWTLVQILYLNPRRGIGSHVTTQSCLQVHICRGIVDHFLSPHLTTAILDKGELIVKLYVCPCPQSLPEKSQHHEHVIS